MSADEDSVSEIELQLTYVPTRMILTSLRSILEEMGYEETMDFVSLGGETDVLEFQKADRTMLLKCCKEGEPEGKIVIKGTAADSEEVAARLPGRIVKPIGKAVLAGLLGEEEAQEVSDRIEKMVTDRIKKANTRS